LDKESKQEKKIKWHSKLTPEQIEELIAEGLEPGDNEYDIYLRNHGINDIIEENVTIESDPSKITQPDPRKTAQPDPRKTAQPDPRKTAQPDPRKTAQPDPSKTTQPDPGKTTQPDPGKTTQPDPSKTTQPDSSRTTQLDPSKTTKPDPSKATQPDSSKTAQSDPSKTTNKLGNYKRLQDIKITIVPVSNRIIIYGKYENGESFGVGRKLDYQNTEIQEMLKSSKQEELAMVKSELDKIEEMLIIEARGEAREEIIEKLQVMRNYKEEEANRLKKEIKNTKYIDPNIVTALGDLGCDNKTILQYIEAIEGNEQLPFELNYDLKDVHKSEMLYNSEKRSINRIANVAEKIGANVEKDGFLKRTFDFIKSIVSKNTRKALVAANKESGIVVNDDKKTVKPSILDRAKGKINEFGKEAYSALKVAGTRIKGQAKGENPMETEMKVEGIRNAPFVTKVKVDEKKAITAMEAKSAAAPQPEKAPIK